MYSKFENDADDIYSSNATAKTTWREHEKPHHNMQMIRYIEEEEDPNRSNLI